MQALATEPKKRIRKSRGKGMRTTTGCLTCRKRHKKCDEHQPVCGPCSVSSRECLYAGAETRHDGRSRINPRVRRASGPAPPAVATAQGDGEEEAQGLASETVGDEPLGLQHADAPTTHFGATTSLQPSLLSSSGFYPESPAAGTAPRQRQLPLDDGHGQLQYVYSPDTVASELLTADLASTRWLDLLATDAAQADKGFSLAPTRPPSPAPNLRHGVVYPPHLTRSSSSSLGGLAVSGGHAVTGPVSGLRDGTNAGDGVASSERQAWQEEEEIALRDEEAVLFRAFTERAALWLDLFDPHKHFSTLATRLALRNQGLMKAILALTSRHAMASTRDQDAAAAVDASVPVQYYYETLHYVQDALQYTSYTRSQELLATVIIISTYEMLDDASGNWKRHLKGVFWIQRSQDVNGASGGLRQAVWWAWLRQDLWAAFRERRACFSFWRPAADLPDLSQDELADRAVYLLSQSVNYCAAAATASASNGPESSTSTADRIQSGDVLLAALERWRTFLGPAYEPLPSPRRAAAADACVFRPIWIHPPRFAVAMQVYHFARILITLHRPAAAAGFQGYLRTQRILSEAVDAICGIAMELRDEGSQIISAQCLFGAGLCTQDPVKREAIIDLMGKCEDRTGWPMAAMRADLRAEWVKFG